MDTPAHIVAGIYLVSFGCAMCTSSMRTQPAVLGFLSLFGSTKYQMRPPPGNLYWNRAYVLPP